MPRIEGEEVFVSLLFSLKSACDMTDQTILVLRYVHLIKVISQELPNLTDLGVRYRLPLGDDGAADLTLFMKHLGESRVVRLDGTAAVFHGDLLLVDELRHHTGDIQLLPTIRDPLIAALEVCHRGAQFFGVLYLQILLHLAGGFIVRSRAEECLLRTAQDGGDIGLAVRILADQRKVAIDMGNKILQRLIDPPLGVAGFQRQMFPIHVEGGCFDCLDESCSCFRFVLARLFLMASDDDLHRLRKLRHVFLHDVLLHLHGVFEGLIIGGISENHQRLPGGFSRQIEVGFLHRIRSHREDPEFHAARCCTDGSRVHHRIDGKIIFAVIAIFLGDVDIAENHAANLRHNGGGIHDGIAVNVALNILLLIGKEVIDVPCATDVVLREESFERRAHLLTHGNLVHADLVRHEDHEIVEFRLHVVHIAHEIEEFQDGYILHLQTVARLSCPLGALDDTTDGAVKEGMHGVIEEVKGGKSVFVLMLDFLCRLLEARQHGAFAAGEMRAGVAVFPDFDEDLLHEDELIRHEGEGSHKFSGIVIALDVTHRLRKAKEVSEDGVVLVIESFQYLLRFRRFFQDALLDHLVRRSR